MFHTRQFIIPGDLVLGYTGYNFIHPIYVDIDVNERSSTCIRGVEVFHRDLIDLPYGTEFRYDKRSRKRLSPGDIRFNSDADEVRSTKQQVIRIFLLRPIPSLLSKILPRHTQIIFPEDMAGILSELNIGCGSCVFESGTGSGSLTHRFALSILPSGKLTTVEFHDTRREKVTRLLERHGLSPHPVQVLGGDVCCESTIQELISATYDCIFLDIPNPWDFLRNGQGRILKTGGAFASFSPCIEQSQKTVHFLSLSGLFTNVRTIEVSARWYDLISTSVEDEKSSLSVKKHLFFPNSNGHGHTAYMTFALRK